MSFESEEEGTEQRRTWCRSSSRKPSESGCGVVSGRRGGRGKATHIEAVISKTLPDTRNHVQRAENVLRVIEHLCLGMRISIAYQSSIGRSTYEVDFTFMAHEPDDGHAPGQGVRFVHERGAAVDVVPPQAIHERLDRLEGAFVKDEVA